MVTTPNAHRSGYSTNRTSNNKPRLSTLPSTSPGVFTYGSVASTQAQHIEPPTGSEYEGLSNPGVEPAAPRSLLFIRIVVTNNQMTHRIMRAVLQSATARSLLFIRIADGGQTTM